MRSMVHREISASPDDERGGMFIPLEGRRKQEVWRVDTILADEELVRGAGNFSSSSDSTGHVLRIYDIDVTRSRGTRQTELPRSCSRFDSGFHFKATRFQTGRGGSSSFSIVKLLSRGISLCY